MPSSAVNPDGSLKSREDWKAVGVVVEDGAATGARAVCVAPVTVGALQPNFPGAIGLFSQLDIAISLAFLRRFPTEARAARLTAGGELRIAHWLKANHYCGRHTARELVDQLTAAAEGRVTGAAAEASEDIVTTPVEVLTALRSKRDDLESRIREALLAHPDGSVF